MSPQSKTPRSPEVDEDVPLADAHGHDDPVRPVPVVIGEFLKAHYRDLVDAPVPDHLLRLMEMLEQREVGEGDVSAPSTEVQATGDDDVAR
jgi:Anti-sigma factor NepR